MVLLLHLLTFPDLMVSFFFFSIYAWGTCMPEVPPGTQQAPLWSSTLSGCLRAGSTIDTSTFLEHVASDMDSRQNTGCSYILNSNHVLRISCL